MNGQQSPLQPNPIGENKIDILALIKTVWIGRKTIILSTITGAIIGVIVALSSAKEYTASTVMVPQLSSDSQSKLGGLGGLAALAGISLDNMGQGNELTPMVYPQIVSGVPFQLELMNTPFNFEEYPEPITLLEYYAKNKKASIFGTIMKYTIGLPGVLIKAIRGEPKEFVMHGDSTIQPIRLTKEQYIAKKMLDNLVTLEVNAKQGFLTLTVRMPEPLVAAQLAQKAQSLMQNFITEFKIEKTKANLQFIQGRYDEIKTEFEKAQVSLALVSDRNKNFTSGVPQIETDRIQTRYTIALNVFQELAKQLEQAKIQVKKETPVFSIIQPVIVPSEKSKPKRVLILAVWIFLAGVIGLGIVLARDQIDPLKKQWEEKTL